MTNSGPSTGSARASSNAPGPTSTTWPLFIASQVAQGNTHGPLAALVQEWHFIPGQQPEGADQVQPGHGGQRGRGDQQRQPGVGQHENVQPAERRRGGQAPNAVEPLD